MLHRALKIIFSGGFAHRELHSNAMHIDRLISSDSYGGLTKRKETYGKRTNCKRNCARIKNN